MKAISQFVVDRLLSLIYTKIRGTGKAMLAVSSIPIAIKYYQYIRTMMTQMCKMPRFQKYKDADSLYCSVVKREQHLGLYWYNMLGRVENVSILDSLAHGILSIHSYNDDADVQNAALPEI